MDLEHMTQQQAAQRIDQLETLTGMLYVALQTFAQPRQYFHRGGQTLYIFTEEEQQRARQVRMYALRVMAEVGAPLPAQPFSIPTVPLYGRSYTNPNLGRPSGGPSPFTAGLDDQTQH